MTSDALESNYKNVFDGASGFGKRPAILVIDFVRAYTTQGSPLYAPAVIDAVRETTGLLRAARRAKLPIIFTRVEYHPSGIDGGIFVRKVPALRMLVAGQPMGELHPDLQVQPDELVLVKNYASAFFGTTLAATLTAQGVDTVVIVGCSTSGCVRASAVDAMQHGFRVVVPRECVGDRHPAPHEANLFDINAKYGDVLPLAAVLQLINQM